MKDYRKAITPNAFCFNHGFWAFRTGWLDNPYPADTDASREFERGFNRAYAIQQQFCKDRYKPENVIGP